MAWPAMSLYYSILHCHFEASLGFVGFGLTALVERCRKGKVGIRQRYPILIGPY